MHNFLQSQTLLGRVLICSLSLILSSCTSKPSEYDQQQVINQALQHSYQFQQRSATLGGPAAFYVAPLSF